MFSPRVLAGMTALRRHHAAGLLWACIADDLSDAPYTVKVNSLSSLLAVDRKTMRSAIRLLTTHEYIREVVPATAGTAGLFVLGPRFTSAPATSPPRNPLLSPLRGSSDDRTDIQDLPGAA